ncbi:MAG TPA: DNA-3-methyladenine glycosylase I [Candidatus Sulfotelmatobacter sp.]|jgi:DNA-3-methyladenine glycosylase I|nr:DNA-3-methyladenine glycosylase I [Candidatus Sulfotelmatobacter sp.]
MSWYCDIAPGHPFHGPYHDREYGFPLRGDAELFERLSLEIMQAGLSWLIVLKKRDALKSAFDGFDPAKVATYGDEEVGHLLANPGIIRNRLKIAAIIENARRLLAIIERHGSFAAWMDGQGDLGKEQWVKLFRKTFKFMGGEVVGEFLMSIGRLPGAHRPDCPAQAAIDALKG